MSNNQNLPLMGLVLIIFITTLIILVSVYKYKTDSTSYCSRNPEKCVCEKYQFEKRGLIGEDFTSWQKAFPEEKGCYNKGQDVFCPTQKCSEFRKKTQQELDIDVCNNNPREDEKCKCEEYFECYISETINCGIPNSNNTYNITLRTTQPNTCASKYESYNCTFVEGITKNIECLKSRPKTECEKGNPKWVEETNINMQNLGVVSKKKEYEVCSNECYKKFYYSQKDDEFCSLQCKSKYSDTELTNKTICREKTEVEKFMEWECEELFNRIRFCDKNLCAEKLYSLKLVYKQKQCPI